MNAVPGYELFISYRRDGGLEYARMIYLELKGRGYNAFFDYNSLRDGKFNEEIFKAIDECKYFILVLSTGALDRCNDANDWVRCEIEYALSKNKPIIPVCPAGSVRGFPEKMPESFEPLRNRQISMLLMDDLFEKSVDKIVEDRFTAEFRKGRTPVGGVTGVTSKVFTRIGLGIIAAILVGAGIIGFVTMRNREIENDRPKLGEKPTQKMPDKVSAETNEVKVDRETERESETVQCLVKEDAEIQAKLVVVDNQIDVAAKEIKRLEPLWRMNRNLQSGPGYKVSLDQARSSLQAAEEEKKSLSLKSIQLQKARARAEAVEKAYHDAVANGANSKELEQTRAELENLVVRVVARRGRVEAVKDQIPEEELVKARQLDELSVAERGSLMDALEKTRAADAAYADLLDKVINAKLQRMTAATENLPKHSKWKTVEKFLRQIEVIDPDNERIKSALQEVAEYVSPSMCVTAELNGAEVKDATFYVDGNDGTPIQPPFKYVFDGDGAWKFNTLDAVYTQDGKHYYAKMFRPRPTWKGVTNIVLRLKECIPAGTTVDVNIDDETSMTMVWCAPGSDLIKYMDADTEKENEVAKIVPVGFWIAKHELTFRQFQSLQGKKRREMMNRQSPLPFRGNQGGLPEGGAPDQPVSMSYMEFDHGLFPWELYRNGMWFGVPSVGEWIRAARFGGDVPLENDFADYAWCMENAGTNKSFAVCGKKPNKLGLYDVWGNVPEWTRGAARQWLGVSKDAGRKKHPLTRMGGGCLDDYESSLDMARKSTDKYDSNREQGNAGLRLMGVSIFIYEQSFVEWTSVKRGLNSKDEKVRQSAVDKLRQWATTSDDSVLRGMAAKEFVSRGGNPETAGIELTVPVRLSLVQSCTDQVRLAQFATDDENQEVRLKAFEKLEAPSPMVTAKYLSRINKGQMGSHPKTNRAYLEVSLGMSKLPDDVVSWYAKKSLDANLRVAAINVLRDVRVLKEIALNDQNRYCVFTAIKKIKDRAVLMEIKQETKNKNVRAAAMDRLEELSR